MEELRRSLHSHDLEVEIANTTDTHTGPTRPFVKLEAHDSSNHQFSTTVRGPQELLHVR
jgi:hypothetical protein